MPAKPLTLDLASLETRHYVFEGVGATPEQAELVLRAALRRHCREVRLPFPQFRRDHYYDPAEVVATARELTAGAGYRDRSQITL